jgi:hypothetical protein
METLQLLGTALGLGLVAGARLYATVLAVGLMIRFGLVELPSRLADLGVLADGRIIAAAGALYLVEFVADKVPWVDSLWDALHTFIRPIGAAALALAAATSADRSTELLLALGAGGAGLAAHAAKASARLAINHSPEPFSNIGMSLAEDAVVPVAAWFALVHPLMTLALAIGFIGLVTWMIPKIFRLIRRSWSALGARARALAAPRSI